MGFELINTYLNNRGLQNPMLDILEQDAALYNALLFQPVENIEYDNDFIRISNRATAEEKFRAFFQMAIDQHAKIAITPEYSCPWSGIEEMLQNGGNLEEDSIWIVGCESIKAQELNELVNRHNHITWIYEADKVTANFTNNSFFDPVCYLFKTRSQQNEIRTVVIIQFKTHHFGGAGMEWERDNFIPGEAIYIIENREESTRLVTFICSDSLNAKPNFNITNLPQFINSPYLIVHIQLNKAPNHIDYSRYRSETYRRGWGNKDFICLNWGRNVVIDEQIWNEYGGSALYIQSIGDDEKKFDVGDQRINSNHKGGLYYTRWTERKAHLYFFNYDEHLFLLRNTKPSQSAALPATRSKSGPEMIHVYSWNEANNKWDIILSADDGFNDVCNELHETGNYTTIKNINTINPVDAERLVYLSVGNALYKGWHLPTANGFFRIEDDEINKRITFTQNPVAAARQIKKEHLQHYGTLEYRIIIEEGNFPDVLQDLKNNCVIKYRENGYQNEYSLNLFPINEPGVPASGVFIGIKTKEDAQNILTKMTELFPENHFGKRIVIWYFDGGGQIQMESHSEKAKITDNTSGSTRSIRSTKAK